MKSSTYSLTEAQLDAAIQGLRILEQHVREQVQSLVGLKSSPVAAPKAPTQKQKSGPGKWVTAEEVERIKALSAAGNTQKEISELTGRSRSAVYVALRGKKRRYKSTQREAA